MSYVVLARKWRPSYFEDVVGQGHVARTLSNAIEQDRVAHAYLFCGARARRQDLGQRASSPRRSIATEARGRGALLRLRVVPGGDRGAPATDVFEIERRPRTAASTRSASCARARATRRAATASRFTSSTKSTCSRPRRSTPCSRRSREPPAHVKFVFATTEPQKIPVTILSRCQRFDFKRIAAAEIADYLQELCAKEAIEITREALELIARQASGGDARRALAHRSGHRVRARRDRRRRGRRRARRRQPPARRRARPRRRHARPPAPRSPPSTRSTATATTSTSSPANSSGTCAI